MIESYAKRTKSNKLFCEQKNPVIIKATKYSFVLEHNNCRVSFLSVHGIIIMEYLDIGFYDLDICRP